MADSEDAAKLGPIDFSTFIVSLAGNVMVLLGHSPEGGEGQPSTRNLPMARQTIDILGILQEKTKGNLSTEEEQLLERLLYQCRMAFVEATKQG